VGHAVWLVGAAWAGAVAAGGLALLLYALVLYPFTPRVSTLLRAREAHPSVVLTRDGEELTRFARSGREWVPLSSVAPVMLDALVATEDRRFYEHGGVDYRRLAGAVVRTLQGDREGGSTITQQLARNLFPEEIGNRRSASRKIRETLTAWKIERLYTKDEILELYLNTVPFLYDAVGVERAADTYFSTDAASLSAPQAAMLVAMLKGTSYYNPRRHPERALARRNLVLGLMVRDGHLTAEEAARHREAPLGLRFRRAPMLRSRAPHFTEYVRRQLASWAEDTGHNLYGEGLTIHTTLDWRMQSAGAAAVATFGDALQDVADVEWSRARMPSLGRTTTPYSRARASADPFAHYFADRTASVDALIRAREEYRAAVGAGASPADALARLRSRSSFMDSLRADVTRLEVGLVGIDPANGQVRVWIGSRNSRRTPYDHVARARRQPGSTFKPFVYARAFEEGWRPDDAVMDDSVRIEMGDGSIWTPEDAAGPTGRPVTLRDGLAYSKNAVAVRLIQSVGPRDAARLARRAGIASPLEPVPSLALGTSEVSLLELAGAYATLAAEGVRHAPTVVTHITDRDGHEVARFAPEPAAVIDADVARATVDLMRGVVDRGTGRELRSSFGLRGDLAGKTGTTQDGADGWFLMAHPDLVLGAWVGFPSPLVTFRSTYWGQGGHNALRVVGDAARTMQRGGQLPASAAFARPEDDGRRGAPWHVLRRWVDELLREPPAPGADAPPPTGDPATDLQREIEREMGRVGRDLARDAADAARRAAEDGAEELRRGATDAARRAADEAVGRLDEERIRDQLRDAERLLEEFNR